MTVPTGESAPQRFAREQINRAVTKLTRNFTRQVPDGSALEEADRIVDRLNRTELMKLVWGLPPAIFDPMMDHYGDGGLTFDYRKHTGAEHGSIEVHGSDMVSPKTWIRMMVCLFFFNSISVIIRAHGLDQSQGYGRFEAKFGRPPDTTFEFDYLMATGNYPDRTIENKDELVEALAHPTRI